MFMAKLNANWCLKHHLVRHLSPASSANKAHTPNLNHIPRVLDFSSPEFFSRLFILSPVPTNCPWVFEDGLVTAFLLFNTRERKSEGGARGIRMGRRVIRAFNEK